MAGSSKTSLPANKFLLSLSSAVMHKMICRPFSECKAPRLELDDVDGTVYSDVLDMWCGKEGLGDKSLDAVMAMASVADRLGMTEVGAALEDAIVRQLSVDVCGEGQLWSTSVPCATRRMKRTVPRCGFSQLGRGISSVGITVA